MKLNNDAYMSSRQISTLVNLVLSYSLENSEFLSEISFLPTSHESSHGGALEILCQFGPERRDHIKMRIFEGL